MSRDVAGFLMTGTMLTPRPQMGRIGSTGIECEWYASTLEEVADKGRRLRAQAEHRRSPPSLRRNSSSIASPGVAAEIMLAPAALNTLCMLMQPVAYLNIKIDWRASGPGGDRDRRDFIHLQRLRFRLVPLREPAHPFEHCRAPHDNCDSIARYAVPCFSGRPSTVAVQSALGGWPRNSCRRCSSDFALHGDHGTGTGARLALKKN